MRPVILKLATKISLESGTYTGVTPNDPEYKILDPVLTDEMAEIAMGLRVRHFVSPEEVAKKVKKPLDRVTEVLYQLADLGVCRYAKKEGGDKFFLPSMVEVGLGNNDSVAEGSVMEYFNGATDTDRIKYDIAAPTTARYWWLRSPNPWIGNGVRIVTPSGALNSYYAYLGYAVAAACVIY